MEITEFSKKLGDEFIEQLDAYYSLPSKWDDGLDNKIRRWYLDAPTTYPKRPYFSPSSANSCPLELYVKGIGKKRDITPEVPHQARWKNIGTVIGDMIQRDLLDAETRLKEETGTDAKFKFMRTKKGEPAFEDFVKTSAPVKVPNQNGEVVEYYLYGAPDGIMQYTDDEGNKIRVGLEIKSKQTTNAQLSDYSMPEAQEDHRKQVVGYSYMYGVDYYIILYVNASKKSWSMTEEELEKYPDIKAFCYEISDFDRYELLSYLATIQTQINNGVRPSIDPNKWTFNNYKTETIKQLNREDIDKLIDQRKLAEKSNLPKYVVTPLINNIDDIVERWERFNPNDEI